MKRAALVLSLIAAPVAVQEGPQPFLDEGESIEVELREDLNGDGVPDLAYIAAREQNRELRVVTTFVNAVEIGEHPAQILPLDPYPLGTAGLSVKGTVLVLDDLTGGTTAVASTHRFRWDGKLGAMRLIGLDATLYSRTFAHDGREASWNLLTGDLITRRLRLNTGEGDAAYDKVEEKRSKKRSPALGLEHSPSGDELLGWPVAGPDR
ncbi:MAG TPA: hypothetical protein VLA50_08785 [Erythrobacter sp.]|nr:hypothetical protein [Erythrobacter sp.]